MIAEKRLCKCHNKEMRAQKRSDRKSGISWHCIVKLRACQQTRMSKESYQEYTKKWKKENPNYSRDWERENRKGRHVGKYHNRKYRYGLSEEDYLMMIKRQDSKCAICECIFKEGDKICVDHDHQTNEIRKLLCHRCNVGLGHFKDDVDLMHKAIDYLSLFTTKHGKNHQEVIEL
jgi:hypothetical protein